MLAQRQRRQYINDFIFEKAENIKKVDLVLMLKVVDVNHVMVMESFRLKCTF